MDVQPFKRSTDGKACPRLRDLQSIPASAKAVRRLAIEDQLQELNQVQVSETAQDPTDNDAGWRQQLCDGRHEPHSPPRVCCTPVRAGILANAHDEHADVFDASSASCADEHSGNQTPRPCAQPPLPCSRSNVSWLNDIDPHRGGLKYVNYVSEATGLAGFANYALINRGSGSAAAALSAICGAYIPVQIIALVEVMRKLGMTHMHTEEGQFFWSGKAAVSADHVQRHSDQLLAELAVDGGEFETTSLVDFVRASGHWGIEFAQRPTSSASMLPSMFPSALETLQGMHAVLVRQHSHFKAYVRVAAGALMDTWFCLDSSHPNPMEGVIGRLQRPDDMHTQLCTDLRAGRYNWAFVVPTSKLWLAKVGNSAQTVKRFQSALAQVLM